MGRQRSPHGLEELQQWDSCLTLLSDVMVSNVPDKWEWQLNAQKLLTSTSIRTITRYETRVLHENELE